MKRTLLLIFAAVLLLVFVSSGEAWQVNVTNNCKRDVIIDVLGEHLFWRQVDCHMVVPAGEVKACVLPGAICPGEIQAAPGYKRPSNPYDSNPPIEGTPLFCAPGGIACCWNVNVEIAQVKGGNGCEIKLK